MSESDVFEQPVRRAPRTRVRALYDRALLLDLIAVLEESPGGKRRWSVMRAMRTRRARSGHEITPKFEDEIERLFREFCAAEPQREDDTRPFVRPKDKAGEVWAVDGTRLRAFLQSEHLSM